MKKIKEGEEKKSEDDYDMKFKLGIDKEFRDVRDALHK